MPETSFSYHSFFCSLEQMINFGFEVNSSVCSVWLLWGSWKQKAALNNKYIEVYGCNWAFLFKGLDNIWNHQGLKIHMQIYIEKKSYVDVVLDLLSIGLCHSAK